MNKRFSGFIAGVLTTAIVGSLGLTALAATGRMSINVDPINIQVNGQTFKPTDAKGAEVSVFAYNGTTYAPLRALAEAYGLEVGYDSAANMATVKEPGATPAPDTTAPSTDYSSWSKEEEAAYQEFKGMWEVSSVDAQMVVLKCEKDNVATFSNFIKQNDEALIREYSKRCTQELASSNGSGDFQTYVFYYYEETPLWDDCYMRDGAKINGETVYVTTQFRTDIVLGKLNP